MICKMMAGVGIGFLSHFGRPWIDRVVPRVDGLFPITCYTVGGLLTVCVDALLYGPRHAAQTFRSLVLVGAGVCAGWVVSSAKCLAE